MPDSDPNGRAGTVEGAGVELAVREWGEGPPVLMIHGIGDGAAGWRAVAERLAAHARAIAYDRRGYGSSGAPEPYQRTTVQEQAEDAAAVLRARDAVPAVVVGADLGGLVALDLLRRHGDLVRGAVVLEPPLYALVPAATEALSAERLALEEDLREAGPASAAARLLERAGAPPERVQRARADARAVFADYGAQATWPVTRGELRPLGERLTLMRGPSAPPHAAAVVEALAALAPGSRVTVGVDPVAPVLELLSRRGCGSRSRAARPG